MSSFNLRIPQLQKIVPLIMAGQPTPPQTYTPQKKGLNKALLRETNG